MIHGFDGKHPKIHAEAFVHPDATVIGDVEIGARATIWPGAILRGDMGRIVIGAESSIQDGAVVHMTEGWSEAIVGERVTVGHRAVIHGCNVGRGCLIGMGAVLLDNATVGDGCLVAASALVTVGTEIPADSVVMGSPGKVVRTTSDRDKKMLDVGWKSYVDLAKKYREELGSSS